MNWTDCTPTSSRTVAATGTVPETTCWEPGLTSITSGAGSTEPTWLCVEPTTVTACTGAVATRPRESVTRALRSWAPGDALPTVHVYVEEAGARDGPMGWPSRRNCRELIVAGATALATARKATVPDTFEPPRGLDTTTAGTEAWGPVWVITVTVPPLIWSSVSTTLLVASLSVKRWSGSTVAWRM